MTRQNFEITGAKALEQGMKILNDRKIKSALKKGVNGGITVAFYHILERIPSDTGNLRNRMSTYGPKTRRKDGMLHGGVMTPTREELGIPPEDPNYWPAALEYGAKEHWISKRGKGVLGGVLRKSVKHPGIAPVAFMRNGANAAKPTFDKLVAKEVNDAIARAQKQLNRGKAS